MKKFLTGSVVVIAAVSLAGNALLYMRYSTQRPLIEVNSQVIRQKDLQDRLDYLYSNNILKSMIVSDLVMQAADKNHVAPTATDMAAAKEQIERTHPELIKSAQQSDPNLQLFNEEIQTQLALRNLRSAGIEVSDSEAKTYYNLHKADFTLPEQTSSTLVYAEDKVGADTAERLLTNGVSPQVIAGQTGLKVVGINAPPVSDLPVSIKKRIMHLKPGQVRSYPMGSFFITAKVTSVAMPGTPPFDAIKPQVVLAAKLAKSPTDDQTISRLIDNSKIKVESDKYQAAVPQSNNINVASAQ